MSISGQNLTIVIVTLKSQKVIDDCIESIDKNIPIIVVENSNDTDFKKKIENKYSNVKCILSNKNLGMGSANNIGIMSSGTDFVYIVNPDTVLEKDALKQIFLASNKIKDFSILSPICSDFNFPNYKKAQVDNSSEPFKVESIDGFSMLFNKKKFGDNVYFDENFFMYLENDDICKRVIDKGGSLYIIPSAKINHGGAKAVDSKFIKEVELSRNWHWVWSKFYFNKKHFSYLKAINVCMLSYFSSIVKMFFYFLIRNDFKRKIYFNRASGFHNAMRGKPSWYRPNLED